MCSRGQRLSRGKFLVLLLKENLAETCLASGVLRHCRREGENPVLAPSPMLGFAQDPASTPARVLSFPPGLGSGLHALSSFTDMYLIFTSILDRVLMKI